MGEIVVFRTLYSALKPQKPSVLTLAASGITFETGTHSTDLSPSTSRRWWPSSKKCENRVFDLTALGIETLKLDRADEKQRLYFDYSTERIEIGETLTEPEREWLHNMLTQHLAQIR